MCSVRPRRVAATIAVASALLGTSRPAAAQANNEIEVYASALVLPQTMMFELHSNYTASGPLPLPPGAVRGPTVADAWMLGSFSDRPSARFVGSGDDGSAGGAALEHETVEVTTGINDWSEIAFYVLTDVRGSDGVEWLGDNVRPRVRVPASWNWPVGLGLSAEVEYARPAYSDDRLGIELTPIIDKSMGRWYVALNPALDRTWEGPSASDGIAFSPAAKVGFDFDPKVSGGLEYYGAMGRLGDVAPARDQLQQLFGAVDLNLSPLWEINIGVGVGLTPATDRIVAKLIVGRLFSWASRLDTR